MQLHPSFVLPVMPGDTPIGYASKVALGIGRNLRLFLRDIGSDFQRLVDGEAETVEQLCRACGITSTVFSETTLVTLPGRRFSLGGHQLLMDQIQREHLRLCPCCVDEQVSQHGGVLSVTANAYWHLVPLYACPTHNVPIATVPASNGSRRHAHDFAWRLQDAIHSGSFHAADRTRATPSSLIGYVLDVLKGEPGNHWLSCMPLYAAIKVAQLAGAETMGINERRWGGMSQATLHEVGGVGFEILREGEVGLRKIFSEAQSRYFDKHSYSGKLSMFGRLYRFLAEDSDDPAFEPAREVLRRHIIEEMPVGPGDTALGKPVQSRIVHSVRSVAPELGLNTVTAGRRLVRVGILDGSTEHLSPDQRTFEVAKHAIMLARLKTALLRGDAGRYLGIPRIFPGVDALLDMVGSLNIEKTPTTQQLYAKDDLDRFLAYFREKAQPTSDVEGFEVVATAASKAKTSIVAILEMIQDGRLQDIRISPGHDGITAVMVRPLDVRDCLLQQRTWVTLIEAKNILRVSQATLREVVRLELLPTLKAPRHGIEMKELEAFSQRYITMSEIHSVYRPLREKRPTRWTPYKEITEAGVIPVLDRSRYPIYLRDQVTAVLGPPLLPSS